ncbi:hypothetical protein CBS11350_11081 [Aspergillus niger]|nr:hypothetical protein CBS11350_11081 [Aspergillus niger]
MSTEFKQGEAYASLVEKGLFQHNGIKGPTSEVPKSLRDKKKLDTNPLANLKSAVSEQIQKLNDPETSSLPDLKVNNGFTKEEVLKEVVETAGFLEIEGAEEAKKKLMSILSGSGSNGSGSNGSGSNGSGSSDIARSHYIVDPENRSARYAWDKHGLQYAKSVEDEEEITILVEEQTERESMRSKDKKVSYYLVEIKDRDTGIYRRHIKTAADVEPLLDDWNDLETKLVIHTGKEKEKFTRKSTGGVKKFHWYACRRILRGKKSSMARDANTKCCVEFNLVEGIKVLLLNDLRKICGETKVNQWVMEGGERDLQQLPWQVEPQTYDEPNLACQTDQDKCSRKGKTWGQVQKDTYAQLGITTDEGTTPTTGPIIGGLESRVKQIEARVDGLTKEFCDYKGIFQSLVDTIEKNTLKLDKIDEDRLETRNAIKSLSERIDRIGRGTRGDSGISV